MAIPQQVCDEGDVAFVSKWFEIIPLGGDDDDILPARIFAYFERREICFVEDN